MNSVSKEIRLLKRGATWIRARNSVGSLVFHSTEVLTYLRAVEYEKWAVLNRIEDTNTL